MSTDVSNTLVWLGVAWFVWAFAVIWAILAVIGLWKVFTKAGESGWKSIIPIWNTLVWLRIIGRPWWWLFLLLIPIVNVVILVVCLLDTAAAFGRGSGFAVGLLFLTPLFLIILGWGRAEYIGRPAPMALPGESRRERRAARKAASAKVREPLPDLPPLPEMPPMPEPPARSDIPSTPGSAPAQASTDTEEH